jgi:hypothetical protein
MTLEPPDNQYLQAALGYIEHGLFLEANEELEKIDAFNRGAPEVLALRIEIYRGLKKWELMATILLNVVPEFFRQLRAREWS